MKTRFLLLAIVFSTCFVSCKEQIEESQYFGKLPSLGEKYSAAKDNKEREKYSMLISEERRKYMDAELPCEIAEGAPLKVIENLHITTIDDDRFSYEGKLLVTEDIVWDSTIPYSGEIPYAYRQFKEMHQKDWETRQYVICTALDVNDSAIESLNKDHIQPYNESLDIPICDHVASYMLLEHHYIRNFSKLYQRRNVVYQGKGYDTKEKWYKFRAGGFEKRKGIEGLPDPPFDGLTFWNEGDTIIVGCYQGWDKSLNRLKCFRYDLGFRKH